jgi:hypothetical protein
MTLHGGKLSTANWENWRGAGILVLGNGDNVRLTDLKVTNCIIEQQSDSPGPSYIVCFMDASGFRCENVEIAGNQVKGSPTDNRRVIFAVGVRTGSGPCTAGVFGNCRIHDNTFSGVGTMAVLNHSMDGDTRDVRYYGCAIYNHTKPVLLAQQGTIHLLNCTLADNDTAGSGNEVSADGDIFETLYFINSVVKGNLLWRRSGMTVLHLRNTNVGGTVTTDNLDNGGGNLIGQAVNLDANHVPTASSPGLDKGTNFSGGAYTYVDFNFTSPGTYNEGVDVVVGGTPAADPDGDDLVFLTDPAGHARVNGTIDMGAFEYVASGGVDAYGIPDAWKIQYFGSTTGPKTGALEDFDNDGLCNLYEYVAGTCPTNASSRFEIKGISLAGSNASLSFDSATGRSYSAQYSDNLTTTNWGTLTNNVPGTGGTVQISDPNKPSARFYRIRVSLP